MRRARRLLLGVAVAAALTTQLVPAASASATELTLTDPRGTVRWSGQFGPAGVVASLPASCAVTDCDEVFLDLLLQRDEPGDRGLQVGLRWPDEAQDLDLYVYGPDGQLAAQSAGFYASTAESVLIPRPANGRYRILVVPRETTDLSYEGVAQMEPGLRTTPTRDLLPDLIALPPRNATFGAGSYLLAAPSLSPTGCYPEEMVEDGARRCLRFDQILANVGEGAFELRYDITGDGIDRSLNQRVYRSDGTWSDRSAGSYDFHATHAHFHYRDFAVSKLWASDEHGRRLGDEPVKVGQKNGFCVIDIENIWFGRHGDGARTYYFPDCQTPSAGDGSGPVLRQGMSVGWADVYNWFLPDQYIEVSGLADGYYLLDTIADGDGLVLESNERNNSVSALVRICGDEAEVVGQQRSCP